MGLRRAWTVHRVPFWQLQTGRHGRAPFLGVPLIRVKALETFWKIQVSAAHV